jgi:hypothetical protein
MKRVFPPVIFDNKIPEGRRMKLRPEPWAKLWVSIARNDAQTPWVKPGRFLPFPDKMAFFFSYDQNKDIFLVSLRLTYCLNYRYIAVAVPVADI